ncbi:hypothetical protein [Oceanobacillus polygoni]|uniref:Chaperonin cofactor prefoldin n=1 Tax=Oceanobacillus polygoni TaxID=1235259 RepID=A0A9X0Z037_9BACI|nr:hypothetical protein [Oceanobacillus polygoni]MBP2079655.1 chaperonin cofactor prefoldin [Oceanobacillus polygoni]
MSEFEDKVLKLLGEMNNRQKTFHDDVNKRFDNLETDIKELKQGNEMVQQAVRETEVNVRRLVEDEKSIHEIIGEHEISIRSLKRKPV